MSKDVSVYQPKESNESKTIQKVFDKFGGVKNCSVKLDISNQLLSDWKKRGRVPLKKLAWVSKELDCDPMLLNKKELTELLRVLEKWGYAK